jgi:hypothetical protein
VTDKLTFPAESWPLMRRALQHIADHPDEFYMRAYVLRVGGGGWNRKAIERELGHPVPECGTVACLAGRIQLEAGEPPDGADFGSRGALLALGMDVPDDACTCGCDDYALPALPDIQQALVDVFHLEEIRTYAELCEALEARFTFPEPLPEPSAVPA